MEALGTYWEHTVVQAVSGMFADYCAAHHQLRFPNCFLVRWKTDVTLCHRIYSMCFLDSVNMRIGIGHSISIRIGVINIYLAESIRYSPRSCDLGDIRTSAVLELWVSTCQQKQHSQPKVRSKNFDSACVYISWLGNTRPLPAAKRHASRITCT